jgi:hypothetical protein
LEVTGDACGRRRDPVKVRLDVLKIPKTNRWFRKVCRREGRRYVQVSVALDLWFDGRGAKDGGGASVSGEQFRRTGGELSEGKEGETERRQWGITGYKWGGRSGSGRRGKRDGIDGDGFQ